LVALIRETCYIQLPRGTPTAFLLTAIKPYCQDISDDSYEDLPQEQANLSPRRIELPPDKIEQVRQQVDPSDIENLLNLDKTIIVDILLEASPERQQPGHKKFKNKVHFTDDLL
jgi:hypothetical protein